MVLLGWESNGPDTMVMPAYLSSTSLKLDKWVKFQAVLARARRHPAGKRALEALGRSAAHSQDAGKVPARPDEQPIVALPSRAASMRAEGSPAKLRPGGQSYSASPKLDCRFDGFQGRSPGLFA